jgi:hypothetical protein
MKQYLYRKKSKSKFSKNIYKLKQQKREFYKSIVSVFCPVLNNTVYFTSSGFNHLLYDTNRKPRNIDEQYLKLKCLSYAPEVIKKSTVLADTRNYEIKIKGKKKPYIHYAVAYEIEKGKEIRVIVSRFGKGKYKFLSVMPHNKKSKKTLALKTKKHP